MQVKYLISDHKHKKQHMKRIVLAILLAYQFVPASAQYEESEKKGFNKENLFSGGSISLSFFNNTFLVGANPVLGYRLANWVDGGVVVNYQWTSIRDYDYIIDNKLRQSLYGGGVFTRLYPVPFIFAQAQFEHNFISQREIPPPNSGLQERKFKTSGNSFLIGGGYTSGRVRDANTPFFYLSVLFDVSNNNNSPYLDYRGRVIPIIRAGFNIPLFQGGRGLGE